MGPPDPFWSTSPSPAHPLPPPAETIRQRLKSQEMSNSLPLEFINRPHPSQGNLAVLSEERRAPGGLGHHQPCAAGSQKRQPRHPRDRVLLPQGSWARRGRRVRASSAFTVPPRPPPAFVWLCKEAGIPGATGKSENRCSPRAPVDPRKGISIDCHVLPPQQYLRRKSGQGHEFWGRP